MRENNVRQKVAGWIALSLAVVTTPAIHAVTPDAADSIFNQGERVGSVRLHAELGFTAPVQHSIQFGTTGSTIDYLTEGGQDNLFPFLRLSADLDLGTRHSVVLLYQPLELRSQSVLVRDLVIDGLTFPKDSVVNFLYGFSFYRGSYLYDLAPAPERELAIGLSLQIRNATIGFTSLDGEVGRINRDIGPVPILKLRTRRPIGSGGWWLGSEIDGFYAPIKYVNGSDSDVVGSILDASIRAGFPLAKGADFFINLRYLAGGAEGTSNSPSYPSDGFTSNWLQFLTLSLGATLR